MDGRPGPHLTAIVSTYERPDALRLALEALRQAAAEAPDLEVVVADDGSGPATRSVVLEEVRRAAFPVHHSWQPHDGFRLAASRNRAVRLSRGEVLVFIDGDCVVHPRALALHARRTRPGRSHTGARVFLEEEETAGVLDGRLPARDALRRAVRRSRPALLRLAILNRLYGALRLKPRPKLAAANCAVHRRDFERVNGFDERFVGWGLEDDDLARRLRRLGVRIADGSLDCLAMHLFHKVDASHRPSARGSPNDVYFRRDRWLARARRGLVEEPLEGLSFEVLGDPPAGLEPLLARLKAVRGPSGSAPRVSLVFSGSSPRAARGELVLDVPDAAARGGPEALLVFLEREV